MKATRIFAVTLVALTALGLAGWLGWSELGPNSTEGTEGRLRYANISVAQPAEGSDLHARADYAPPESSEKPGGGPVIVVSDVGEERSGYIVIDAVSGEVLVDTISGRLRDQADTVIASLQVEDEQALVWPMVDVAPPGPRVSFGNISYIEPEPSTGIFVIPAQGDGPEGATVGLFLHNGKSRMTVSGRTGTIDMSLVLPEDKQAFERLAATVKVHDKRCNTSGLPMPLAPSSPCDE